MNITLTIILILVTVILAIILGVLTYIDSKGTLTPQSPTGTIPQPSAPTGPVPPAISGHNARYIIPYLMTVYPQVKPGTWSSTNSEVIRKLYQSLNWYYLPLVDDVGIQLIKRPDINVDTEISRRAPLAGPYVKQWTEAFLSDSTDQQLWVSEARNGRCPPNTVTLPSGKCQTDASTTFCSVFPSQIPNSQGPTWYMGAHACDVSELRNNEVSQSCKDKLLAKTSDGHRSNFGPQVDENGRQIISKQFQYITVYQPYGRKHGCPNYGYMEQVAYVCEGMGKTLLTGDDCVTPDLNNSNWVGSYLRNKFCGFECEPSDWNSCIQSARNWTQKNRGIATSAQTLTSVSLSPEVSEDRIQFQTYDENSRYLVEPDLTEIPPDVVGAVPASYYGVPGNLKGTDLGPSGCTFGSGWNVFKATGANGRGIWQRKGNDVDGLTSGTARLTGTNRIPAKLTKQATSRTNICAQNAAYGTNPQCHKTTMYYWNAGYSKFLNMGRTGIYNNYLHFLITLPNEPVNQEGLRLRSCFPEMMSMGVSASALASLKELTSSTTTDPRTHLEGFTSTFQSGSLLGERYRYIPHDYSELLGRNVGYIYDFEATPEDWDNKVIVVTGRLYWAKKWAPHADPLHHGKVMKASDNTWYDEYNKDGPPGCENAGGLVNPQEGIEIYMDHYLRNKRDYLIAPYNFEGDINLCCIATQCVQCYYPPNLRITNPHYRQRVQMDLDDACLLFQNMYIFGDSGGDEYGYSRGAAKCRQNAAQGCANWPYMSAFFSSAVGSCVYALTSALGWNSSQFTVMSTAAGQRKTCCYSAYDFEIVQVGDRSSVCKNIVGEAREENPYGFKLLDISGGGIPDILNFYIKWGFIMGSNANEKDASNQAMSIRLNADRGLYNVVPFSACKMPLSEQNVDPKKWGKKTPNMLFYDEPSGLCRWDIPGYDQCIRAGGTPSGWLYTDRNGDLINASDCPYADAPGTIRTLAQEAGVTGLWAPEWMKHR